jgi:hypothetical protein
MSPRSAHSAARRVETSAAMGSRSRRPVLGGPTRLFAAAFVALCLLPTCSSWEAHDTTRALGEVGSARDGGGRALETPATASTLAPLSARASPRRALAQTPDASASASASASADPDAAASVTASDLAALAGYVRDDVDDRVVILTSHVSLDDGESLPPVEKTISIRGACGSSNTDACVIDAKSLTRHLVVGAVGHLTLENVVLRNGAAKRFAPPSSDGGAVFVFGAFTATRVAFEDCAANKDGTSKGGCVAVAGGVALFTECAFTNAASADDGGAIHASSGVVEVRRSAFEHCAAGGLGGGVAGDSASITLRYCTFDETVTAREEASRDAYVGARGAVYLEPFAIYSDYYGADGALLLDDADAEITGADVGPPEGFSYRAEGAGLVARAGFEPPPPGMGFAPPPPSALSTQSDAQNATDVDASLAVVANGRVSSVSTGFVAGGVAVAFAFLWMLGRFLSKEQHTHRPSERTLKNMRAADDAMLEARRADDEAEALDARDAARAMRAARAAKKERSLSNTLHESHRERHDDIERHAPPIRNFSAMQVVVEDGDDVDADDDADDDGAAEDENRDPARFFLGEKAVAIADADADASLPRVRGSRARGRGRPALAASDVDVALDRVEAEDEEEGGVSEDERDADEDDGASRSEENEDDDSAFRNVENRAPRRRAGTGNGRSRGRLGRSRIGFDRDRRSGVDNDDDAFRDDGDVEGNGALSSDAKRTSAKVRAESDFLRASWAGAAATARAAARFRDGPSVLTTEVPADEDFFETRAQRARAEDSAAKRKEETPNEETSAAVRALGPSRAARVEPRNADAAEPREPNPARLASVASASAAARAVLAMRRGAPGSGPRAATARAGSADALRARVEAARRAAAERAKGGR